MQLGLTPAQLEDRRNSFGGSDANILMSGDEEAIMRLWRFKRREVDADDLSRVLPVQMGNATEPFNRFWYTQETGTILLRVGEKLVDPEHPWRHHNLDGVAIPGYINDGYESPQLLWEAKHTNAFANMDDTVEKYMPQMQHGMSLGGFDACHISVFFGNMKWEYREVPSDIFYQNALLKREQAFWDCVQSGEPPCVERPLELPSTGPAIRKVDMDRNNEWADHAYSWLENQHASKKFWKASDGLKAMIDPDVKIAFGHGVIAKRDVKGAIRITKEK
jgi:predicted phage-related endonuclease